MTVAYWLTSVTMVTWLQSLYSFKVHFFLKSRGVTPDN